MVAEHKKKQRLPWRVIAVPALLGILGIAGFLIFQYVRTELAVHAAEQSLEQYDHTGRRVFLRQARDQLDECLRLSSQNGRLHFLAARAARRDNDFSATRDHLQHAKRLGWVKEAIELEQALAVVQTGKLEQYENVLRAAIEQGHPDRLLILEAVVHGYEKTYHLYEAGRYLDLWLQEEPENSQALLERAEIHLLTMRLPLALNDYRRGVELDPDADAARQKLGGLLLSEQKAKEALPYFEELRRHPGEPSADALLGVARCKALLGDDTGAVADLDELLARHPHHAAALAERGKLAQAQGNSSAAERFLRESVTLAPFEEEAISAFCSCLQKLGKSAEAATWSKRLDAMKADQARLDEVKQALLKSPYDASLRAEMGRVLVRNGHDRDGLMWLRSAQAIDPKHPAVQAALAEYERQVHSKQQPGGGP
jgi:predicted Zn-dependent protease